MTHERKQTMNKTKARQHLLVLWQEYSDEAEHQDGRNYWKDNFENPGQAVEDFTLYLKCRGYMELPADGPAFNSGD